jgi:hypothetical protein
MKNSTDLTDAEISNWASGRPNNPRTEQGVYMALEIQRRRRAVARLVHPSDVAEPTDTLRPVVLTFEALKVVLNTLTPEQLAAPVVWSGDERGGYVKHVYVHSEDWVGDPSDGETWLPRSEALSQYHADDYANADLCIPAGTVHLMVD